MRERALLTYVRLEALGPGDVRLPAWLEGRHVCWLGGRVGANVPLVIVYGGIGGKAAAKKVLVLLKRLGIKAKVEKEPCKQPCRAN